jgi:hypothetical protein
MHTDQIAPPVLDDYKTNKLTDERIEFLISQAKEQIEEISQNEEVYKKFLDEVNAPEKIDTIVLWILLMSNEDVCEDYIYKFKKGFVRRIPASDLADLLVYVLHLKKVQNTELDGLDFLLEQYNDGIEEMDQYAFTNVLHYIQKLKEKDVEMEF